MPRRAATPPPPLDQAALERLALRYVERFATTRKRLIDYLGRKVRERGWDGPAPDAAAIAERFAAAGYIDDRAFGEARAAALARRGLGKRRVAQALHQAGVGGEDAEAIGDQADARALDAALAYARRRRFGPWAAAAADRNARAKQMGAMLRAGHAPDLARKIVTLPPGADADLLRD